MAENGNTENYTADRPIVDPQEDRFQRYNFSKRIADTIINRKSKESIVFGLFGAWGEGKSSVLNFIDTELQKDNTIIRIHLNPWRYSDEDSLLKNFFDKIAKALGKKLKKKKEKIGGFIKRHGSLTRSLGLDITSIGTSMSDSTLETFKERVDGFLNSTENKIVIFVDDIDRLDKQEIYTLFRLVKLTADFSNTTYILSFDEMMVASAIGERFGSGDNKSGTSFLEKIIQVPLTIPKAQPEALKKFCFDLIDHSLKINSVNIPKEDVQRFVYQFSTNVLPRLDTPRLAVRYGNTLSFSIPLLNGEVNMVDLMLIEAVKIFYPEHYSFIKQNPGYFIDPYDNPVFGNDNSKSSKIENHLKELGKSVNNSEGIRYLLVNLFPNLETAFGNYHFSSEDKNAWYLQKRIVSAKYFDRYFSYAVIEGDISDIEFDRLLQNIDSANCVQDISGMIRSLIEKSDPGNFIQKLRSRETEFKWEDCVKIAKALCLVTDLLPNSGGMLGYGFDTTTGQTAIFIYQLLKNNKKEQDIYTLAKELMLFPPDFNFAYQLNNWFRVGDTDEDKLFVTEQYVELAKLLIKRSVDEAGDDSIFEKFPDHVHFLVPVWAEQDRPSLKKYIDEYLDRGKEKVLQLLRAFVPVQRSSVREGEYKTDITKNQFDYITSYFEKDDLYGRILENYSIEEIESEEPYWIDLSTKEFDQLNMVRQYIRWYNKQKEADSQK